MRGVWLEIWSEGEAGARCGGQGLGGRGEDFDFMLKWLEVVRGSEAGEWWYQLLVSKGRPRLQRGCKRGKRRQGDQLWGHCGCAGESPVAETRAELGEIHFGCRQPLGL